MPNQKTFFNGGEPLDYPSLISILLNKDYSYSPFSLQPLSFVWHRCNTYRKYCIHDSMNILGFISCFVLLWFFYSQNEIYSLWFVTFSIKLFNKLVLAFIWNMLNQNFEFISQRIYKIRIHQNSSFIILNVVTNIP